MKNFLKKFYGKGLVLLLTFTLVSLMTIAQSSGALHYREYAGFISQSSTTAPSLTIVKNSTALTITATRTSSGVYVISGTQNVSSSKLWFSITNPVNGTVQVSRIPSGGNTGKISVTTRDLGAAVADSVLVASPIVIRVYN